MKDLALTVGGTKIDTPTEINKVSALTASQIVQWLVMLLIVGSILLTLFFLISGGIDMITSGGDKQKVVNSRHKLTYAVIGLIVVFMSFFIVNMVGGLFGVELIRVPLIPPSCPNGGPC